MRCPQAEMASTFLVTLIAVVAVAAVAAQPSTSTWGGFTPKPAKTSFVCQPLPTLSGEGAQTWRLECSSGNIPVGGAAQGLFNWTAGMTSATTIRSVQLELVDRAGKNAEGTDVLSMSGSFISGSWILPTCSSQQRFSLRDAKAATTTFSWPRSWKGPTAQHSGSPFGCSGKFRALSPAGGSAPGEASTASFGWVPRPVIPTPKGLRVQLSCLKGSAGGSCSVFVRVTVQFRNNTLPQSCDVFEDAAREIETTEKYFVDIRSFNDTLGVLGAKGKIINTEVCYPKRQGTSGRKLLQQAQTLDMAPVYDYDSGIITKATRLARYASAIHGCLPSTPDAPQAYTAADGTRQLRQWTGATGMSNWGGRGRNGQPGPECRSCFKDGISFDGDDAPRGFQTPEFSLFNNRQSFFDAAIAFTDSVISGVDGRDAVVVLFRATVSDVQGSQWLSNLGSCWANADSQVASTSDVASGTVCEGWNTPVQDLINLGLLEDVVRRLEALPESDRQVYVTGHSRGGALAAVFAAKLLALQNTANGLPAYSGEAKDQIKLYTFGAPRVGSTQFAAYLENGMLERYRIINRYDAVPSAPTTGYSHFRPSIWYRDSSGQLTASPSKGCLLLNQDQITERQQECFISCNSALTCTFGAGVNFPNQPANSWSTEQQCQDLSDGVTRGLSAVTVPFASTTLIDHASYLGLDMNNGGCRADLSFINAITIQQRTVFGVPVPGSFSCTAVTASTPGVLA